MKLSLRIIAVLAALLMLVSIVACGNTGNGDTTTTAAAQTSADADSTDTGDPSSPSNVDAQGFLLDDLPTNLNYGGKEITVLAWKDVEHEEFEADADGDIVLNSIFERNKAVEKQLGVTISYIRIDGDSDYRKDWDAYVANNVGNTSHEFDIIAGYSLSVALDCVNGYLYNMLDSECKYLDFDKPWWSSLLIDQATIHNKLYFASGDISRNALEMMYVCYCNTLLLDNHHLENPQNFVESGDWTYEKFIEMCQGIYSDTDGDGKKSASKDTGDTFGYMCSGIHNDPWFYGTGATICEKDADGNIIPSSSFFGEKVGNTVAMLQSLFYTSNDGIYTSSVYHQRAFGDGRLLLMTERARVSHKILAAEYGFTDFVILPCPKYDKDTEKYITVMGNPFTLYAIPADTQDPTLASAFIESFASQGYRKVTPAVFELSLKSRYSFDSTSSKMYDMIRENLTYDIGRIFSGSLIGQGTFRDALAKPGIIWGPTAKNVEQKLKTLSGTLNTNFLEKLN